MPSLSAVLTALSALGATLSTTFKAADYSLATMSKTTGNAVAGVLDLADALDDLREVATQATTAFTKMGALSNIVSVMGTAESDLVKLKTSLRGVKEGVNEYREAMLYAAKTPFSMGEVVRTVSMLRTFEFEPFNVTKNQKDSRILINILGDMAGAMGYSIDTAAHALNRAMVGEWEIMQNRWQISARMIPQLKGLASGTKAYGEAIIKYLSEQVRFKDGMKYTAETIRGLTSNIDDAFDIIKTAISGVIDAEDILKGSTLYDKVRANLRKLYQTASDMDPFTVLTSEFERQAATQERIAKTQDLINKSRKKSDIEKYTISLKNERVLLAAINAEIDRNYKRLRGGKDTFEMMKMMIELGKQRGQISEKSKPIEIQSYLMKTGMFDTNEILTQAQKLENTGRVVGQILGAVYELMASGIVNYVNNLAQTFLNGTSRLLDTMMGGAFSIQNIVEKSAGSTVEKVSKGTIRYMEVVSQYINAKAELGTERMDKFAKDIESILLTAEAPMYKQFMIFAVVVQLMIEFIKLKFEELVKTNPIIALIKEFYNEMTTLIPNMLKLVGMSFKKFMSDNEDLLNVFALGISSVNNELKRLNQIIKQELADGGGEFTNKLSRGLEIVVGLVGLASIKFLSMEKSIARVGAIATRIFGYISAFLVEIPATIAQVIEGVQKLKEGDFEGAKNLFKAATTEFSPEAKAIVDIAEETAKAQELYADTLPDYRTMATYSKLFGGMVSGQKSTKDLLKELGLSPEDAKKELENQKLYRQLLTEQKTFVPTLSGTPSYSDFKTATTPGFEPVVRVPIIPQSPLLGTPRESRISRLEYAPQPQLNAQQMYEVYINTILDREQRERERSQSILRKNQEDMFGKWATPATPIQPIIEAPKSVGGVKDMAETYESFSESFDDIKDKRNDVKESVDSFVEEVVDTTKEAKGVVEEAKSVIKEVKEEIKKIAPSGRGESNWQEFIKKLYPSIFPSERGRGSIKGIPEIYDSFSGSFDSMESFKRRFKRSAGLSTEKSSSQQTLWDKNAIKRMFYDNMSNLIDSYSPEPPYKTSLDIPTLSIESYDKQTKTKTKVLNQDNEYYDGVDRKNLKLNSMVGMSNFNLPKILDITKLLTLFENRREDRDGVKTQASLNDKPRTIVINNNFPNVNTMGEATLNRLNILFRNSTENIMSNYS